MREVLQARSGDRPGGTTKKREKERGKASEAAEGDQAARHRVGPIALFSRKRGWSYLPGLRNLRDLSCLRCLQYVTGLVASKNINGSAGTRYPFWGKRSRLGQ